ncbi:methyltransferase domain-containing protein [Candidatus Micrarchaeota archaeon]|nr:methyltransferase domain-containing protein [Candidatus Micrarchaeota archaeon]
MRILCSHAKKLQIQVRQDQPPNKRSAEVRRLVAKLAHLPKIENPDTRSDNGLLALVCVERGDEVLDLREIRDEIARTKKRVGASEIIVCAFGHLSDIPEEPEVARRILRNLSELLMVDNIVQQPPFGWDKTLTIDVPAHQYNMTGLIFTPKKSWDEIAGEFDSYMLKTGHYRAQSRVLGASREYIRAPVLDICCGTGRSLHWMYRNGMTDYVGIDESANMIRLARQMATVIDPLENMNGTGKRFLCGVAESIGDRMPLRKFKTVLLFNATAYVDLDSVMRQLPAIMETGAKLIVADEDPFVFSAMGKDSSMRGAIESMARRKSVDVIANRIRARFNQIGHVDVPIDEKHNLVGMIFEKP